MVFRSDRNNGPTTGLVMEMKGRTRLLEVSRSREVETRGVHGSFMR